MWRSWWIAIAGTGLILGGVAWLSKLAVIVATEGRVTTTGAAGAFFALGLALILFGSTGIGLRLTIDGNARSRVTAMVLSPLGFVVSYMVLQGLIVGLFHAAQAIIGNLGPDYVREEAIILLTAVASLAGGAMLIRDSVRGWRGPRGSRAARVK